MPIDIHGHLVPPRLLDEVRQIGKRLSGIELIEGETAPRVVFRGSQPTRPIYPSLLDPASSESWMENEGIDLQLVSVWSDLVGYQLPSDEGTLWSRLVNDSLVELCSDSNSFAPIATVPLQDPTRAAAELSRAVEMGCVGVMIETTVAGQDLDDVEFLPFWKAAAALNVPVFIHPKYLGEDPRIGFDLANVVGRGVDTTISLCRLIFSRLLIDYPDIRVIAAHGGGAIPFLLGRMRFMHSAVPYQVGLESALERIYFDSVVFDPETLRFLIDTVGADHVLLGSDHPMGASEPQPLRFLERSVSNVRVREAVSGDNARLLFDI